MFPCQCSACYVYACQDTLFCPKGLVLIQSCHSAIWKYLVSTYEDKNRRTDIKVNTVKSLPSGYIIFLPNRILIFEYLQVRFQASQTLWVLLWHNVYRMILHFTFRLYNSMMPDLKADSINVFDAPYRDWGGPARHYTGYSGCGMLSSTSTCHVLLLL